MKIMYTDSKLKGMVDGISRSVDGILAPQLIHVQLPTFATDLSD